MQAADRSAVYLRVAVYIVLYGLAIFLSARLMVFALGYFLGVILSQFLAAILTNWLVLRIYGRRSLSDLGLKLNPESARNLGLGIAGGMGAAALVLAPPLATSMAHWTSSAEAPSGIWTVLFTTAVLFAGSAGEEILFRGYAFQELIEAWGPFATIFTVAAVFALLHGGNPNSTWLALVNTAGFGALFGYAFLRSGDLWLPIGLHFGWNFALPLFGVNVSGLTIKLVGHDMAWTVGPMWSGGEYGPEGSVLTTIVLGVLAVFVWKAPVQKQESRVVACAP